MSTPTTVVVIDDHPVVHVGVQRWVTETQGHTGEVVSYHAAADFLREHRRRSAKPVAVIYDPERGEQPPDHEGLRQLCELKYPVIAYSRITSTEIILSYLDVGAASYIAKSEPPQHLMDAIVAVQSGSEYHGPSALAALHAARQHGRPDLTTQERRVLTAWLRTENKESVGRDLHIASSTVRTHLQRIRRRYCEIDRPAPSKAALFARALQDGLLGVHDI